MWKKILKKSMRRTATEANKAVLAQIDQVIEDQESESKLSAFSQSKSGLFS